MRALATAAEFLLPANFLPTQLQRATIAGVPVHEEPPDAPAPAPPPEINYVYYTGALRHAWERCLRLRIGV
jgi:hypothetical protein